MPGLNYYALTALFTCTLLCPVVSLVSHYIKTGDPIGVVDGKLEVTNVPTSFGAPKSVPVPSYGILYSGWTPNPERTVTSPSWLQVYCTLLELYKWTQWAQNP